MSIQIRPITADELDAFQEAMMVPFLIDRSADRTENFKELFELHRLRAAFDGDQIVATFGAFSFQMVVPGNVLPMAGTTIVTVLPTHRRQGILRSLMTDHFAELHDGGEPLAALWASESSIYGRFGYGPATERAIARLEKPFARLRQPVEIAGTMRLVDRNEALTVFPEIYDRIVRTRPGMYLRTKHWWRHRILRDPEFKRAGASTHRRVLHLRDGQPVGYAIYRTRADSNQAELHVIEVIAIDADAEKSLWEYLFATDLITSIECWNQPLDDPLRWWLEQPREMERKIEDSLWVRPVDVVASLNGRRYSSDGSVVFRMRDELCPWNEGVFRLEVDEEGIGRCEQTSAGAEFELTPFALGAVYLGGQRLRDLARSALVTGSAEALRRADAMFTWDPRPWCQEIF
jgi:predicted acetyltransferase